MGAVAFRLGDGSDCVCPRRLLVMDCVVVNIEDHAGGSSASGLRAQESRSSTTGYGEGEGTHGAFGFIAVRNGYVPRA